MALGIVARTLLRRTLPAMAITIGVFTVLRLVIGQDLRPHYMRAITTTFSFLRPSPAPTGSYWLVSGSLVGPGGQVASGPAHSGPTLTLDGVPISINNMPSACRALVFQDPRGTASCLTAHGYHGLLAYQPANRYWAFQGIETGVFVLLAVALIAVTAIAITRRDA